MPSKLTTKEFIKRSKIKFGNMFNYVNTNYEGRHVKLSITCPVHGEVMITPTVHLSDKHCGCMECQLENRKDTLTNFISKANSVHKNKYDYSYAIYKNSRTKLKIICPEHGEFEQTPNSHIHSANGCPKCGMNVKIESFKNSKVNDKNLNYIYILEIHSENEKFYKIGITYQKPKKRIEHIKCTSNKKYIANLIWSTGKNVTTYNAVEIEKNMSKIFSNKKYIPQHSFSGYTECYIFDDIDTVIASLEVAIQDKGK